MGTKENKVAVKKFVNFDTIEVKITVKTDNREDGKEDYHRAHIPLKTGSFRYLGLLFGIPERRLNLA